MSVTTTEFNPANSTPPQKGWYLCRAIGARWGGSTKYRTWSEGCWWIPLPDGWIEGPTDVYEWHGPVAEVDGPAPDGTNPTPTEQQTS